MKIILGVLSGLVLSNQILIGGDVTKEKIAVIENGQISLTVHQEGAIISDLHRSDSSENWLSQKSKAWQGMYAHFLCFDRWGRTTEEEMYLGIPFHGEAAQQIWCVEPGDTLQQNLNTILPVAGFSAHRKVSVAPNGTAFSIVNTFKNRTRFRRPYNAVEHITLSKLGFADGVRLVTNAERGYVIYNNKTIPGSTYRWPFMRYKDREWDLRSGVRIEGMLITPLVFDNETQWGWVCVENSQAGEGLVYLWRTKDFPWLMLWSNCRNGKVVDRAIEPGTTGRNLPMQHLMKHGPMLGRQIVRYLDPDEEAVFQMWGYIYNLNSDKKRISDITVRNNMVRMEFGDVDTIELFPLNF